VKGKRINRNGYETVVGKPERLIRFFGDPTVVVDKLKKRC
jgi:hypothetical protein